MDTVIDSSLETQLVEHPSSDFITTFLNKHYVNENEVGLRLDYNKDHLYSWLQTPVDCKAYFMILKKDTKPLGIVGCKLMDVWSEGEIFKTAEINFLCVHTKHRGKNYHKILIKKITDFAKKSGAQGAIFTGKPNLPYRVLTESQYYHLNLSYYHKGNIHMFNKLFSTDYTVKKIDKKNHQQIAECIKEYETFKDSQYKVHIKNDWSPRLMMSSNSYVYGIYDKDKLISAILLYRLNAVNKYNQTLNRLYIHSYYYHQGYDIKKLLVKLFKEIASDYPRTEILALKQMKHGDILNSLGFMKGSALFNYYTHIVPIYYCEPDKVGFFLT